MCDTAWDHATYPCRTWLPDGYSQIFRWYVFGPSGFWTMAPLRYAANFAIWQPWSEVGRERHCSEIPLSNRACVMLRDSMFKIRNGLTHSTNRLFWHRQRQTFLLSFELFVLMLPPSPSANQLPNKRKIAQLKGSFCLWWNTIVVDDLNGYFCGKYHVVN